MRYTVAPITTTVEGQTGLDTIEGSTGLTDRGITAIGIIITGQKNGDTMVETTGKTCTITLKETGRKSYPKDVKTKKSNVAIISTE